MRALPTCLVLCLLSGCRVVAVDEREEAIVGGKLTSGFPFVGYVSADYGGSSSGCTGTLVRDRWFLTAAHCLEEDGDTIQAVRVTFEADSNKAKVWHDAKSWSQHPKYGQPFPGDAHYYINRGYDCALVELNAPASGVTRVPYGTFTMDASFVGRAVTQVGYGFTSGNFTGSGSKRELATQIADVHDGVLGLSENGTGTCQGDSGGPTLLVENGVTHVVGVSSYGSPGCPGGGWMSRTHLCAAWLDSKAGPWQVAPDMAEPPPPPLDMTSPPPPDMAAPPSPTPDPPGGGSMPAPCETGGGCAIASGGATPHGWILLAAAVWLLRRRRC